MTNTEQYREHINRTFNAFCKIVLYHVAPGAYKELWKKRQFEVSTKDRQKYRQRIVQAAKRACCL